MPKSGYFLAIYYYLIGNYCLTIRYSLTSHCYLTFVLCFGALSSHAVTTYRYINPEGNLFFTSTRQYDSNYIELIQTERGWEPKPPPIVNNANKKRYAGVVKRVAEAYQLPSNLIHAIIAVESRYEPNTISPKGAQGLMQLMPEITQRFKVRNPLDPEQNIEGGGKYLQHLVRLFNGDLKLILAAYNMGEEIIKTYNNQIPPDEETKTYIREVIRQYHLYSE